MLATSASSRVDFKDKCLVLQIDYQGIKVSNP